jgi:hypothetical protein
LEDSGHFGGHGSEGARYRRRLEEAARGRCPVKHSVDLLLQLGKASTSINVVIPIATAEARTCSIVRGAGGESPPVLSWDCAVVSEGR